MIIKKNHLVRTNLKKLREQFTLCIMKFMIVEFVLQCSPIIHSMSKTPIVFHGFQQFVVKHTVQ